MAPPSILVFIASSHPDSQCFIAISPPHHYHQYVIKLYPSLVNVKMVIKFRQLWCTSQSLKPITFSAPQSFCHLLNFIPCSPNPLLTNHMPLETKYFSKVLWNHTYFWEKSGSIDTIMADKMDIWQSLGLQGNCHTLPDQSSLYSTIVSNEITSFPPSFSVMGLVQGKTSEILLPLTHCCHEMIYLDRKSVV